MIGSLNPGLIWLLSPLLLVLAALITFLNDTLKWHDTQANSHKTRQLPPKAPTLVPYLGCIIPFLHNPGKYLQRVSTFSGHLTSSRVAVLPGWEIYFLQDRWTVKEAWKQSAILSAVKVRVYSYKYLFGMPSKWLHLYANDDSGPFPKPFPKSNVPAEQRIHYKLHAGLEKALIGSGFAPTLKRYKDGLVEHMYGLDISEAEWTNMPDLRKFIHHSVGLSFIKAVFGPGLIKINPEFIDDLFEFDHLIPWLGKGVPQFLRPRPYRVRERLHNSFKRWYKYARDNFDDSCVDKDGDADPFWGSTWMRQRQSALAFVQDDDVLAAADLGAAWASIENMVPCAIMALIHVLEDKVVQDRFISEVHSNFGDQLTTDIDLKKLTNVPLLSSIYAETLRLHVKTYTVISSPHEHISLGRWWIPRGAVGLVNSDVSHMDESFWNSKAGLHPVREFWSDRFITDPTDPSSGPMRPELPDRPIQIDIQGDVRSSQPFCSMDGLEGSWVPYGGGHLMCPGRFLAKNAILFACCLFVRDFEIELCTDTMEFGSARYGLGTEEPSKCVPFRIRRKSLLSERNSTENSMIPI